MNIDIICPLYNSEQNVLQLYKQINDQMLKYDYKITFILTESLDNTEKLLIDNNIKYEKIIKKDFSHSLIRERYAKQSRANIICFISQDIEIANENWLKELVLPLINNEADACFSRQISKYKNIEKYTREYNYPCESYIRTKKDISEYGLKTFFFSDVSSAIKKEIFEKMNYYDNKDLVINEDMYLAYKIITNGYKIKYCSNSVVYHSHNYNLKTLYLRYKDIGLFFKKNNYLKKYGTNKSGFNMAIFIFLSIIKNKDIKSLLVFPFDMTARYLGMKVGEKS